MTASARRGSAPTGRPLACTILGAATAHRTPTPSAGARRSRFTFTGDARALALELADGLGPAVVAVLVAELLTLAGELAAHG